jgi:hypothetical protein
MAPLKFVLDAIAARVFKHLLAKLLPILLVNPWGIHMVSMSVFL